jgi:hypothetical protein
MENRMLSQLSEQLLHLHADRSGELFYGLDVLPGLFRNSDLQRLDDAYKELEAQGLLAKTNVVLTFFGDPKPAYRITDQGAEHVKRSSAA